MIVVFLIVLIMALIIANMLVSAAKPKKTAQSGLDGGEGGESIAQVPEVIEHLENIHENTALIKGGLAATNQKIELLNKRVSTLEKVTMTLTAQKLGEKEAAGKTKKSLK